MPISKIERAGMPGGAVLQVVSVTKTDVFNSTSTSFVDITGLAASITPISATSKILVQVSMVAGADPYNVLCAFRMLRNSTAICVGDAASGYQQTTVGNQRDSYDTNSGFNLSMNYLDSPATTSATTYKVQGYCESGSFKVNACGSNAANSIWSTRSASTITLMEIAA